MRRGRPPSRNGRDRTPPPSFGSRPESPAESTDERQMLLDVERNIANLEKTFTDSRRPSGRQDDGRGRKDDGGGAVGRTHGKGLFRYSSSFGSDRDVADGGGGGGNDRKR